VTHRNVDVPSLRAALWAYRALRRVQHDLEANGLRYRPVPAPPQLPPHARRGVNAVLRRRTSTCLERALVLQRWHVAHGSAPDVVIAVRGPTIDFAAHAWVDGEPNGDVGSYQELVRLRPR
jgi:hypothetical protein